MNDKATIGILGCGWLGKATAQVLIEQGYKVKGSTTSNKSSQQLIDIGVQPFVVNLTPKIPIRHLENFLSGLQVLVIAIPPKFREGNKDLLNTFKLMFEYHDFSNIKQLIYVSSTGVFEDDIEVYYNEDSIPNSTSKRGLHLIELERLIANQNHLKSVIVRYGGLIKHEGRHPVHYLSGKKDLSNPNGPVNLIEQYDAVHLLCKIIESSPQSRIYHGVYPSHSSRKNYYTDKAKSLDLELPVFTKEGTSLGKTILSEKTQNDLGFTFNSAI